MQRQGADLEKVKKTVLKVVICPWLTSSLSSMLGSLPLWPLRSVVNKNMSESFRITYPFTRVTLDCTEEKVQTPSSKVLNSQIYTKYKNHTTCKGLIGITPCGTVSFISSVYTGWISDKEITPRSGILDLLHVLIYQQWNQRILGIIFTGTTKSANSILVKILLDYFHDYPKVWFGLGLTRFTCK